LAAGLASVTGLDASSIAIDVLCSRRLGAMPDVRHPRVLQGTEQAIVAYTMTVPAGGGVSQATAVVQAIQSETPTSLTQKMETAFKDEGISSMAVSVNSIAVPVVSAPATTPNPNNEDTEEPLSAASRLHVAFSTLSLAVAAALAAVLMTGP